MTIQIPAVYEQGKFRPASPLKLQEGTEVVLTINTPTNLRSPHELVDALAIIAAIPVQGPGDAFSAADHDQVLYGDKGVW